MGGDWYANPSSLPNLLEAIRDRTSLNVANRPADVKLTGPDLGDYPYLYATGHGSIHFTDEELFRLRAYLTAGGPSTGWRRFGSWRVRGPYTFGAVLFLMAYAVVRQERTLRSLASWREIVATVHRGCCNDALSASSV